MLSRLPLAIVRLAGAALVVSAEIYLIVVLGSDFSLVNNFSYFTVLSNLFAAAVLLVGAFRSVSAVVRGAAVLYMTTTGIVYWTLLSGVDVATPDYANYVLHLVMPVLVLLEWLIWPPGRSVSLDGAALWLVFPIAYVGYSLIRGAVTGWYPYPFLDPDPGGYGKVATMSVIIAVGIIGLAAAVRWSARRSTPWTDRPGG